MSKLIDWLDERVGIRQLWDEAANEPIPGGARLRYVFGSVLVYLFMQQVVLGVLLALYYSPSATDAWASTAYIQDRLTGGWFIRGLHHHGSSAMVIVVALHMLQVVWAGAYRRPREVNWWTGLVMGFLILAFALTGYLLPWDQKGYWATQVATGIMGTVPGGEPLRTLVQGGSQYGNYTVTHFYAIHVFVLPILLGGLLALHIYLFRRHGITYPEAPPDELERKKTVFIPNQLVLDMLAMTVTGIALVLVTFYTHGAELFAPAQPASNFVARPEWYFLFLFQMLKYFEGPLSIVATVILPGAATVFLLALPWVDRAQSRSAKKRMPVLAAIGVGMGAVVALTAVAIAEDAANEKYQEGLEEAHAEAEAARKWAKQGVLPEGGDAVFRNDPAYQKKALFAEHCETCHTIDGVGGDEAPVLTDYSSRAWIRQLIRNPNADEYFGQTPHDLMDPYPEEDLPDAKLDAIVEFVVSLMGDERMNVDEALAAKGKKEFDEEQDCSSCHMLDPNEDGDGPNLQGHGTVAWVERVIRDSSKEDLFGEAAKMPKFEGKLSNEEITMLAEYVVSQRYDEETAASEEGDGSAKSATEEAAAEEEPAEEEAAEEEPAEEAAAEEEPAEGEDAEPSE